MFGNENCVTNFDNKTSSMMLLEEDLKNFESVELSKDGKEILVDGKPAFKNVNTMER